MLPPIFATLYGNSAVEAIVDDRIYPHADAPQGVDRPYITWQQISLVPANNLSSTPGIDRCAVQIDCWHPTSDGLRSLAVAVRDAIEPHCHITGAPVDLRDPETRLYRYAWQADWWLNR